VTDPTATLVATAGLLAVAALAGAVGSLRASVDSLRGAHDRHRAALASLRAAVRQLRQDRGLPPAPPEDDPEDTSPRIGFRR
jgi:hypothetical protein